VFISAGTLNHWLRELMGSQTAALPQMNDDESTTDPQSDPAPFKVHLLTRAGRVMRARSEPVRAFSNTDEAIRLAGRQLGGHYAVYHKHKKIWPAP
jgi:hypothetical protein